jgi:hypothetical protein
MDLLHARGGKDADIYVMRADGSGVVKVVEQSGYDGGPFFSPDGDGWCTGRTARAMTCSRFMSLISPSTLPGTSRARRTSGSSPTTTT